jgi:hypothetical protein
MYERHCPKRALEGNLEEKHARFDSRNVEQRPALEATVERGHRRKHCHGEKVGHAAALSEREMAVEQTPAHVARWRANQEPT